MAFSRGNTWRSGWVRPILLVVAAVAAGGSWGDARPMDGERSAMQSFDREMEQFMRARGVPGGSLAVVKDRRLVYARGYGWADRENGRPARADSLFRIASISKPITGVAVLQLVEEGRLRLDDPAFPMLGLEPVLALGARPDPRLRKVTVRQLLHHTGGWDRDKSFDPMFRPTLVAEAVGAEAPAGPDAVIRYMLGQPLDFDPGSRYAYSNFGYCVLGRIIEKVSGRSYEEYVKRYVLAPAGIKGMRIGRSLAEGRAKREVRYYTSDSGKGQSVFPEVKAEVPAPYGTFHLEAMDAHGGWLASAVDLARFAAALDDPQRSPLLKPGSFGTLYARPDAPVWRNADGAPTDYYYAAGWLVRPVEAAGQARG
ncbi:MAG TPA: serine hydrolase domain-containing protein, partial [Armatimonadota bacterium]|nr:serine hydrolase domain-containing protein [Armatimonadota bacterium]